MDGLKERIERLKEKLKIEELRKKIREVEMASEKPEFWQDHDRAAVRMKALAAWREEVEEVEELELLADCGEEA